jgi:hypothetical protein
LRLRIA